MVYKAVGLLSSSSPMMVTRITPILPHRSIPRRALQPLQAVQLPPRRASSTSNSSGSSFRQGFAEFKPFVRPFAKVFLGAIFVYQVIHWTWLKLEMDESKLEKNKEVAKLEKQAREMAAVKK